MGVVEDAWNAAAAVPDHLAGSTDETFHTWLQQSDRIARSDLGPGQRFVGYLRLTTRHGLGPIGRDVEDIAFESPSGGFMGNEDGIDLPGPSWTPGGLGDGWLGTGIEWRDPRADDDPTHPDNWLFEAKVLLAAAAVVGALYLLAGPMNLLAALLGGGE